MRECDEDELLLLEAAPRRWLEHGKQIRIERAPTRSGTLNLEVVSRVDRGEISATVRLSPRKRPTALLVRLRHPRGQLIRSVSVNGQAWTDFDPVKEWVRISAPSVECFKIVARY